MSERITKNVILMPSHVMKKNLKTSSITYFFQLLPSQSLKSNKKGKARIYKMSSQDIRKAHSFLTMRLSVLDSRQNSVFFLTN